MESVPEILRDLEKQIWRGCHARNAKHFVAVFVQPRQGGNLHENVAAVLETMLADIRADVLVAGPTWSERSEVPGLHLAILQLSTGALGTSGVEP